MNLAHSYGYGRPILGPVCREPVRVSGEKCGVAASFLASTAIHFQDGGAREFYASVGWELHVAWV